MLLLIYKHNVYLQVKSCVRLRWVGVKLYIYINIYVCVCVCVWTLTFVQLLFYSFWYRTDSFKWVVKCKISLCEMFNLLGIERIGASRWFKVYFTTNVPVNFPVNAAERHCWQMSTWLRHFCISFTKFVKPAAAWALYLRANQLWHSLFTSCFNFTTLVQNTHADAHGSYI